MLLLYRKGLKKQRGALIGTGLMLLIVAFSLMLALTVLTNADRCVGDEMARMGYGDLTVWVSGADDALAAQIERVGGVTSVTTQPLVFAGYELGGAYSDDEGQLLPYQPEQFAYRFLSPDMNAHIEPPRIQSGEVYLSPAMKASYAVELGDTIRFSLSRDGAEAAFTVAGWFEDPFLGGSMIDRKCFLIGAEDFAALQATVSAIDPFQVLARNGEMLHIFGDGSMSELSRAVYAQTSLGQYAEFTYSRASVHSFMMLLQNVFSGFLGAFSLVLTVIAMIVLSHHIAATIEQDSRGMAILRTMGYTVRSLRTVQTAQTLTGVLPALLLALPLTALAAKFVPKLTVTSLGLLTPSGLPALGCVCVIAALAALLSAAAYAKTSAVGHIKPAAVLTGRTEATHAPSRAATPIRAKSLTLHLALRRVVSGWRRYVGVGLIALLLTLFVCLIGRMDAWLGPNGEGLMNAFSAAAHDLGVQPVTGTDMAAVEALIERYEPIVSRYRLAMQPVNLNGADVTANVLDDSSWFHVLQGKTANQPDEVLVTGSIAQEMQLTVGDTVTISAANGSADYRVVGVYQCANGMGANIGMSKEGYARIADTDGYIWCYHYLFADSSRNEEILDAVSAQYRLSADIHSNSWSGLSGIVRTMRLLIAVMYLLTAAFVLVAVALASARTLRSERRDMAAFRAMGYSSRRLRLSFALRFAMVAAVGGIVGVALSCTIGDPLIARLLSLFGIGEFRSALTLANGVLPTLALVALFAVFAYLASRSVKRLQPMRLLGEFDG